MDTVIHDGRIRQFREETGAAEGRTVTAVGPQQRVGDIVGQIRRRLLINSWVDPSEVAPRMPAGLRPHIGSGGVAVGCCMIEITSARPWPLPGQLGVTIRAAAHRISVEAGSIEDPTRAVYVPMRHTNSRGAVLIGGRLFPGVHMPASVELDADDLLS